ncbi:MAG: hypothetical protein LBK41_00890 [Clostridiales bacterium]|nr:hypothetical protein [Clostridiales bacterium]
MTFTLETVEQGILAVPEAYREGVWDNVRTGDWFPQTAHKNTWRLWTRRFLWHVAENLGEI